MPLSIRDEETTQLVRRLAARKGISLTEAVRTAVKDALTALPESGVRPSERIAALRSEAAARGFDARGADKAFFDGLSDE